MTIPKRPDDRKCKAKAKHSGNPCKRWAIPGGTVCASHGGNAPQTRDAANRRVAAQAIEADIEATLAHEGIEAIEDPLDELGKLASSARALMHNLGSRVNALEEIETWDEKNAPHVRVAVELYERAMDRTHRLLDSLIKHGYAERQVTLAENEAMLVAGVIRRVLAGLGLTAEQQKLGQSLLAQEFREIEKAAQRA